MLNKLFFASLLALSSSAAVTTATADTAVGIRPGPPSRACLVTMNTAKELFKVERKSDIAKDYVFTTFAFHTNGAWTYTETKNGKVQRTEAGCLGRELGILTNALSQATWKTTAQKIRCMAYAADYTEYSYNGKSVLTSRMCDGLIIDKLTQDALREVTTFTTRLVPPTTP